MRALLVVVSVALFATASTASTLTGIGNGSGWAGGAWGTSPAAQGGSNGRATRPIDALAQAGERVGQDPDPEGVDALPDSSEPGKRVGQDPDVPGGSAAGTPKIAEPEERVGQDPDVPGGDAPVR